MKTQTSQDATRALSTSEKFDSVRGLLTRYRPQLEMALPRHLKPDRLIRVALTSVQKNPALLECHPITLVGAVVQCAQLGLEPDDGTGKAYLVPFFNSKKNRSEVQFIVGYRGLIDLARRSGQVSAVEARVVHKKDYFEYAFGLQPALDHRPSTDSEPGEPIYFYAIARFRTGDTQFDVMTKSEVDTIRKRSKAGQAGPWVSDYEEMGKKTVVRRLAKLLPASAEFLRAVSLDERADIGIPQDLGTLIDPAETGTPVEQAVDPVDMPQEVGTTSSELPGMVPAKPSHAH